MERIILDPTKCVDVGYVKAYAVSSMRESLIRLNQGSG